MPLTDAVADAGKRDKDRNDATDDLEEVLAGDDVGILLSAECCTAAENRAAGSRQGEPRADYN